MIFVEVIFWDRFGSVYAYTVYTYVGKTVLAGSLEWNLVKEAGVQRS